LVVKFLMKIAPRRAGLGPPGALPGGRILDIDSIVNRGKKWSGREDFNLRPPGPELWKYKLQVLYLVSLRDFGTRQKYPSNDCLE